MKNWDKDLSFGHAGENFVEDIFNGQGSLEVKTEREIWAKTGNWVFEFRGRDGRPTGLSITNAQWWAVVLYDKTYKGVFIFEVPRLRKVLRALLDRGLVKIKSGGDDGASKMLIVKPSMLIGEYHAECKKETF